MEFPAVTYAALSGEGGLACGGLFVPDEMDAVRFLRDRGKMVRSARCGEARNPSSALSVFSKRKGHLLLCVFLKNAKEKAIVEKSRPSEPSSKRFDKRRTSYRKAVRYSPFSYGEKVPEGGMRGSRPFRISPKFKAYQSPKIGHILDQS